MWAPVFALGSAVCWGAADFLGGIKTRENSVATVGAASQFIGGLGAAVIILLTGAAGPATQAIGFGALAGLVNTVGLCAFYQGLAVGRMSVVAPIAGLGVAVPVAVGLASGEQPGAVRALGIVVAIGGVMLATRRPEESMPGERRNLALLLAVLAGFGIGGNLALLDHAIKHQPAGSVLWAVACSRAAAVLVLAPVALMRRGEPRRSAAALAGLTLLGLTDLGANLLYGLAARVSLLSLAAVLASLHPAVTVLLARSVLSERMHGVQQLGVGLAILGACLLSVS